MTATIGSWHSNVGGYYGFYMNIHNPNDGTERLESRRLGLGILGDLLLQKSLFEEAVQSHAVVSSHDRRHPHEGGIEDCFSCGCVE